MPTRQFQGVLASGHKEDAVAVPFDPVAEWSLPSVQIEPGRRGVAVLARVGEVEFTTFVVSRSRRNWLLVDARVKAIARLATGDILDITLAPANSPRQTGP